MDIPVVRQTPPNPLAASQNRRVFDQLGLVCLHLIGGAGSGKTALLETILPRLRGLRVAVISGDASATCDAQRIRALGVPAVPVLTDGECHLSAAQGQRGMAELPLRQLDLLLIENVGGTLCAEQVDLGEHGRIVTLSVAAGQQILSKQPRLIREAALVLLTKYDLLPYVQLDLVGMMERLHELNPSAEVICTDIRNRVGIDRTAGWLMGYVRAQHGQGAPLMQRGTARAVPPALAASGRQVCEHALL